MLKTISFIAVSLVTIATLVGETGVPRTAPQVFARLELSDGRTFKDVVVKSYDRQTDKVLVVTAGKAITLPVSLVPAPFDQQMRGAPLSGESVTTFVAPRSTAPVIAASAVTESPRPSERTTREMLIPSGPLRPAAVRSPSAPIMVDGARRATGTRPAVVIETTRPVSAPTTAPHADESAAGRHRVVAEKAAERYYRHDFSPGSGSIRVTELDVELEEPKPVEGWQGRFRASGKARLEYYDSKGGSFQRVSSTFEITTEQPAGEPIKVVELTRKS